MAITTTLCDSYFKALMDGELDFSSDTTQVFKVALYTSSATLNASTGTYGATSNELTNGVAGYTAGGATIVIATNPTIASNVCYVDFTDTTWSTASFTARGCLIYRSDSDIALAVIDFGSDKTGDGNDFTLDWPVSGASTSILRLS